MRLIVVTLAAATAVSLAACAENGPPSSPGSPPPSSEDQSGELTVRGTVKAGIEAGCLVLESEGEQYLLIDGDPPPRPGSVVEVTGRVDRDVISICQQGIPLRVSRIQPG